MNRYYPLRVWGLAIALPAALLFVAVLLFGNPNEDPFVQGGAALLFGYVLSFPMMLLFTAICKRMAEKGLNIVIAKALIWAMAFGLLAASFGIGFFFYEPLDGEMAIFGIVVYGISWGISILLFRLRNKVSAANAEIV